MEKNTDGYGTPFSMYIETVQDCTSHKNMITLNVQHFFIQFRRYLVYFIGMLESGYLKITKWYRGEFLGEISGVGDTRTLPSNSSKIQKTPEMNELDPGVKSLIFLAHNFEK